MVLRLRSRMIAVYRVEPSDCLRTSEATRHSCRLYVASATDKLRGMPTNPAQAPESGKSVKIGLSEDFSREKIDRRICVAPMMDWSDDRQTALPIRHLQVAE